MQPEDAGNYILNRLRTALPDCYLYHNADHTLDVFNACKQLAAMENISGHELQLLLTAAYYHDSGFLYQADRHEMKSCEITREVLPSFGYQPAEIDQICRLIMATKIPQTPGSHLGEILADADLDYLGRNDFSVISDKLYAELLALNNNLPKEEWNKIQVAFLKNHRYFTGAAVELRQLKKQSHLEILEAKLKVG
jgi:predicted metal-dependent HD superfamily phosphohydrolase